MPTPRHTSCKVEERVTVQARRENNVCRPPQHQPQPQQTKYWAPRTHKRSNAHHPFGRADKDDKETRTQCHRGGSNVLFGCSVGVFDLFITL